MDVLQAFLLMYPQPAKTMLRPVYAARIRSRILLCTRPPAPGTHAPCFYRRRFAAHITLSLKSHTVPSLPFLSLRSWFKKILADP